MILERLEALPVGSFHYKLLLVTGLGWLFDSTSINKMWSIFSMYKSS